jgi:hypothetical protein
MEYIPGGMVGALVDDIPPLLTAHIRPYVVAILLHRGAVRSGEVIACLIPHCSSDDIREGAWDEMIGDYREAGKVDELVDEILGEMTSEGLLRYSEELDLWILTPAATRKAISWAAETNGKMPNHLLMELGQGNIH